MLGRADANQSAVDARAADIETDVSFAGDPTMVPLDDSGGVGSYKITVMVQNSGSRVLDHTNLALFVNGNPFGDGSDQTLADGSALPNTSALAAGQGQTDRSRARAEGFLRSP